MLAAFQQKIHNLRGIMAVIQAHYGIEEMYWIQYIRYARVLFNFKYDPAS